MRTALMVAMRSGWSRVALAPVLVLTLNALPTAPPHTTLYGVLGLLTGMISTQAFMSLYPTGRTRPAPPHLCERASDVARRVGVRPGVLRLRQAQRGVAQVLKRPWRDPVVVLDEQLEQLESLCEVVLAHEFAHLTPSARRLHRISTVCDLAAPFAMLVLLPATPLPVAALTVLAPLGILLGAAVRRREELLADIIALRAFPHRFSAMAQLLDPTDTRRSWVSTHPNDATRLENLHRVSRLTR